MEARIEGKMYGAHIECTMNRDSFRGNNVWRLIKKIQCMETHIEGTRYGDS